MPKPKYKVITAVFDIKPVNENGVVDFEKISRIQPVLNLGRKFRINKNGGVSFKNKKPILEKVLSPEPISQLITEALSKKIDLADPQEEFETYFNKELDLRTELASIGAQIRETKDSRPRYKNIKRDWKSEPEDNFQHIINQINQRVPERPENQFIAEPVTIEPLGFDILTAKLVENPKEPDALIRDISEKVADYSYAKKLRFPKLKLPKLSRTWLLVIATSLSGLTIFGHYGFSLQRELVAEGNSAVINLENAGQNIKKMDFVSASNDFAQAYQEFSKAGESMNFMGASISSLLSDLPGAGKLKSAKNLVEFGKLMANAGQAMSDAMGELAKTNSILNPLESASGSDVSIGNISVSLKKALILSQKNLGKAKQLLADVDSSSIPEDKQASFEEFKSKLPIFEKLVNDSVDYSKFLDNFIGTKGTKKYLILFQNPSELRPTGGFPGTYGVILFKDGKLQDFMVDDVYNLDGQLQELIIPPVQLQHITPNWGMRDANWFVDFPTSARKMTTFFKKESGYDVDGVITFSPQIVTHILDIVGPVEMPEYNLTLDSNNLLSALQEAVEYKGDRKQPKQIIKDLAPKMLKKLYSAESGKWLDVFNLLLSSMEQKDILMYFRDLNLESFSVDKGFSGQVRNTDSDYLMVTFTNVKGSKTDLVIDSSLKVQTTTPTLRSGQAESGDVKHKVSITRTHNGGSNKYGFYNKQNPTYVRVLVPENAQFVGLTGNSKPDFKPLIDYANSGFKKDDDLAKFEEKSQMDKQTGVTIYKEAGKTEFGFWMIINPGETKTIDLDYTVPSSGETYKLYLQKQPSLDIKSFELYINGKSYFDGRLDKDMLISPK